MTDSKVTMMIYYPPLLLSLDHTLNCMAESLKGTQLLQDYAREIEWHLH